MLPPSSVRLLARGVLLLLVASRTNGIVSFENERSSAKSKSPSGNFFLGTDWSYEEDRIESLPGYDNRALPTRQYSGYLDATEGCDTQANGDFCHVHYWLCTAESAVNRAKESQSDDSDTHKNDETSIPIVVWFNGGPGASSMVGLFQELGPLLLNQDGTLIENPFAWTKVAHLLVLESPVGVGYSTCQAEQETSDSDDDDDDITASCVNTDQSTAEAARAALISFMIKFPHLAFNDVYLTGESYAGVYVPTLAYEIFHYNRRTDKRHDVTIPLRGILVGDPCTDNTAQGESMNPLWYGHQYGLVDDAVYDTLTNDPLCQQWVQELQSDGPLGVEPLSIDSTTATTNSTTQQSLRKPWQRLPPSCVVAYRKFLLSSSRGIDGKWNEHYVDRFSLFAPVTNALNDALTTYMNRPDVQNAIHVTPLKARPWAIHAVDFDYTKQYRACNRWADKDNTTLSMIDVYRKIIPHLRATWIINGNTDPAVSYEGTRVAVRRIGLAELDGGGYRPWFYNQSAVTVPLEFLRDKPVLFGPDLTLSATGVQFGGEVVNFEHNLAFVMVHGSGHMIPQFRPHAALHILTKLLSSDSYGAPMLLSPLTPSNETLAAMSMHDYYLALNVWTKLAKSTRYVCPIAAKQLP